MMLLDTSQVRKSVVLVPVSSRRLLGSVIPVAPVAAVTGTPTALPVAAATAPIAVATGNPMQVE